MRSNKFGLADLKQLRKAAASAAKAPAPANNKAQPGTGGGPGREVAPRRAGTDRRAGSTPAEYGDEGSTTEGLAPEDRRLFKQAVKSAHPLKKSMLAVLTPAPVAPTAILKQRRAYAAGETIKPPPALSDHYAAPRIQADGSYVQAGCGPDLLKKLRRGHWIVGASIDLHGATLDEARSRLDQFLQSCLDHDIKCVRVVYGKGYGSKDEGPVLPPAARRWLAQMRNVIAYTPCAEQDGGDGALLVLLRKDRASTPRP